MDPGYDAAEAGPAPEQDGYGSPQPIEGDPEPVAPVRIKQEPPEEPSEELQTLVEQNVSIHIKQEPVDPDEQPAEDGARDASEGFYVLGELQNAPILGALEIAVPDSTTSPHQEEAALISNGQHIRIKMEPLDSPNSDDQQPEAVPKHINIKTEIKPEPVDHAEDEEHEDYEAARESSDIREVSMDYDVPGTSDGRVQGTPQLRQRAGGPEPKKIQVPFEGNHIKLEVKDHAEMADLPPKIREIQQKVNEIANTKPDKRMVKVEQPMDADAEVVVTQMTT